MPYDHKEFKFSFNMHNRHICLHMESHTRSRDEHNVMWLTSFSIGSLHLAAIFFIEFIDHD